MGVFQFWGRMYEHAFLPPSIPPLAGGLGKLPPDVGGTEGGRTQIRPQIEMHPQSLRPPFAYVLLIAQIFIAELAGQLTLFPGANQPFKIEQG